MCPKIAPKYKMKKSFQKVVKYGGKKGYLATMKFFLSHLCKISYMPKKKNTYTYWYSTGLNWNWRFLSNLKTSLKKKPFGEFKTKNPVLHVHFGNMQCDNCHFFNCRINIFYRTCFVVGTQFNVTLLSLIVLGTSLVAHEQYLNQERKIY
jgi:hypothetical protein